MNFFTTSDNKAIDTQSTFDMGGGNFEPIPENTQLKVIVSEAKWEEYDNVKNISIKWDIIEGEFKGRKIFQKVRVLDADAKKADKAKTMLAAIDGNAGGALMAAGVMPDDMALSINLMNKPMAIVVSIWDMNGKTGNWVKAVAPLNAPATTPVAATPKPQAPTVGSTDFDDDIGF